MKKKIIIIVSVVLATILVVLGIIFLSKFADKVYKPDIPSAPTAEIPSVSTSSEDESQSEKDSVNKTEVKIENEKHKFTFYKTDFEKRYSDEFLMDIAEMLGMAYGYENFIFWNEDPEKVVNSLISCCIPSYKYPFKTIYCEDEQVVEKGIAELKKLLPDNPYYCEFVEIETLNAYFEKMFGPDVRKFRADEFMTFDESVKKYGDAFNGRSDTYDAIRYLPESGLLCFCSVATGFSCRSSYIYDVREINGDYNVYTLGNDEVYYEEFNFDSHQAAAFNQLTWGGTEYVENYVYTFGSSDDGNLYLKSIDKNYLFAEGFEPEYRITKDTEAIDDISYLFPPAVVGTLKKGETVHVEESGMLNGKEVAYVITEDFAGYVDYECVEKIY